MLKIHYVIAKGMKISSPGKVAPLSNCGRPYSRLITSAGVVDLPSERLPNIVDLPGEIAPLHLFSGRNILESAPMILEKDAEIMATLKERSGIFDPIYLNQKISENDIPLYGPGFASAVWSHYVNGPVLELHRSQLSDYAKSTISNIYLRLFTSNMCEYPVRSSELSGLPHLTVLLWSKIALGAEMQAAVIFDDPDKGKLVWEKRLKDAPPAITPVSDWKVCEEKCILLSRRDLAYLLNSCSS